ncbi:MAG: helix-turn-helix domain-containing protein [Sulfurifustaceae bacterium]
MYLKELAVAAATRKKTAPPYGALSHEMKDHSYVLRSGFIFTSPWVVTERTVRHPAAILLTAKYRPFELRTNRSADYLAAAIKPVTSRSLRAADVGLVSVHIHPNHPQFRRFRAIPKPGVMQLDRAAFTRFDDTLLAAYRGELSVAEAVKLFEDVVATTVEFLPVVKRMDARVEQAIELLQKDASYPLKELAAKLGLSYDHMSHLFSEAVGLPLRSYQLWQKAYNAGFLFASGRTLTDIAHATGFTDSAHLSHTFKQSYGASPSYLMDRKRVEIFVQPPVNEPAAAEKQQESASIKSETAADS